MFTVSLHLHCFGLHNSVLLLTSPFCCAGLELCLRSTGWCWRWLGERLRSCRRRAGRRGLQCVWEAWRSQTGGVETKSWECILLWLMHCCSSWSRCTVENAGPDQGRTAYPCCVEGWRRAWCPNWPTLVWHTTSGLSLVSTEGPHPQLWVAHRSPRRSLSGRVLCRSTSSCWHCRSTEFCWRLRPQSYLEALKHINY